MNLASAIAVLVFAVPHGVSAQSIPAKPSTQTASTSGMPDGEFVGLQTLKGMGEPNARWFHENTLVVRGTEVILDMNPVVFHNGKEAYSASDGGFLTYRGNSLARMDNFLSPCD
jgi:hypothetical protein